MIWNFDTLIKKIDIIKINSVGNIYISTGYAEILAEDIGKWN